MDHFVASLLISFVCAFIGFRWGLQAGRILERQEFTKRNAAIIDAMEKMKEVG